MDRMSIDTTEGGKLILRLSRREAEALHAAATRTIANEQASNDGRHTPRSRALLATRVRLGLFLLATTGVPIR